MLLMIETKTAAMRFVGMIVLILVAGFAAAATAQVNVADFSAGTDDQGAPQGWQLTKRTGHADFSLVDIGGVRALKLRSDSASFSFQREVKADLTQFPILSWKWKVTKLPERGDFRKTATDDQAAQLFVSFGRARTIVYIWDSNAPEGMMADAPAPPFMAIKAVVVRSHGAQLGKWLTETRNVFEDYQHFFGQGSNPPPVSGVRIQINSQHTKSTAESYFAEVAFKKAT